MWKHPVVLLIAGYFCFAAQAVIQQKFLSKFNPFGVLAVMYTTSIPMTLMVVTAIKVGDIKGPHPTTWVAVAWCTAAMLAYFLGDLAVIGGYAEAYKRGGEWGNTLSILVVLYPVFIAVFFLILGGKAPNRFHWLAFVLIFCGIGASVKAQMVEDKAAEAAKSTAAPPAP